jgi:hypothetical protein
MFLPPLLLLFDIAVQGERVAQMKKYSLLSNQVMMNSNIDEGMQALLDHQMDLDTKEIMKARFAKQTHKGYDGRNVPFMLLLFNSPDEKYPPLLQESLLLDMVEAHTKDLLALTKRGQPSKTRTCVRILCAVHWLQS